MSLAQGNNTPTRPRIEPGSPDPESDALTTRRVRSSEAVLMSNRKAMNRNWSNQKPNPALKTKMGNKYELQQEIGCKQGFQYTPRNVELLESRYVQTPVNLSYCFQD